ncbi:MAG: CPBP family intramembrane metalloprotease [Tissierellia bacterium]|nr:CPBP family intramembrane metalloprotease [Tissierellia bacterium]
MNNLINSILQYPQYKLMVKLFFITWPLANIINFLPLLKGVELTEEELAQEEEIYKNLTLNKLIKRLIEAGIIGPYLETLVFQFLVFRLVGWVGKGGSNSMVIALCISAFVFAPAHILVNKEWYAVFIHLPLGIALALIFMISDINNTKPVLHTTLFHGFWNIVTIVLNSIIGKLYYSRKISQ